MQPPARPPLSVTVTSAALLLTLHRGGWDGDVTLSRLHTCVPYLPLGTIRDSVCPPVPSRHSGLPAAVLFEGTSGCGVNSDADQEGCPGGVAVPPESSRRRAGLEDSQFTDEAQRGPGTCPASPSRPDQSQAFRPASGESGAGAQESEPRSLVCDGQFCGSQV